MIKRNIFFNYTKMLSSNQILEIRKTSLIFKESYENQIPFLETLSKGELLKIIEQREEIWRNVVSDLIEQIFLKHNVASELLLDKIMNPE